MATKSVIEIDIVDEKFQAFAKEFEKLKKSTEAFSETMSKSGSGGAKEANKTSDAIKKAEKNQKDFNKAIKDGGIELKNVALTAAGIAKSMADTAVSAAKWLTLGAIGSGWGLAGIAQAVGNDRNLAIGFGIESGQVRASRNILNRYGLDSDSLLKSLNVGLNDPNQMAVLGRLGVNVNQNDPNRAKDPLQALMQMLPTLASFKDTYKGNAAAMWNQQFAGTGISYDVVNLLSNLKKQHPEEFKAIPKDIVAESGKLASRDSAEARYQKFLQQLDEAGLRIRSVFVDHSGKLAESLTKLSSSVADAITNLLESKNFKDAIDWLDVHIKEFAEYLTGEQVKKDMQTFLTAVVNVTNGLERLLKWLNVIPKTAKEKEKDKIVSDITLGGSQNVGGLLENVWDSVSNAEENAKKSPTDKLKNVNDFLSGTPILDAAKNFISSFIDASKNLKKLNTQEGLLKSLEPELAERLKKLNLPIISGKRGAEWAENNAIWNEAHKRYETKEGHPIAMHGSKHLTGEAADIQLPEEWKKGTWEELNQHLAPFKLYAPLKEYNEWNHIQKLPATTPASQQVSFRVNVNEVAGANTFSVLAGMFGQYSGLTSVG